MHSGTPPSVFSGRGGRCGAKDGVPLPETNGCSCISGCGASPNPGGRRSAPSGRPAASPVTARGSAREPKVLAMRWGMEANMAGSREGREPSALRVFRRERPCDTQAAPCLIPPSARNRGRPWRGGKPSDHVGEDLEELNTAVFQIEPQNLNSLLLALALDYPFTRRRSSICRRPCRPTKPQNLRGSLPMKGWALWEQ